jgi:hypothetical protein
VSVHVDILQNQDLVDDSTNLDLQSKPPKKTTFQHLQSSTHTAGIMHVRKPFPKEDDLVMILLGRRGRSRPNGHGFEHGVGKSGDQSDITRERINDR